MPADPRRVKAIFGAALAVTDPAARLALLDRECDGDAELRYRLDDLLRAHDHPASALERPLAVAIGDVRTIDHTPASGPGTVLVGRYKLLERIGEGAWARSGSPTSSNRSAAGSRSRRSSGAWTARPSWPASKRSGRPWP